ncbi:MAG: hypothetical protein E6124_00820 [Blautia producta]|nr:hypothetical protein [Blautia producta]MDU5380728.1 hypothetical protein [Blautia producta]MDU6882052.1 hypothetical protein [Blautia producta]
MKTIYDFSALDNIFKSPDANALIPQIQKYIKKNMHGVSFRECFVFLNPDNFTSLTGVVYVHVKRIYSLKTYKPIKDIYTVGAYKLTYATRKAVWEDKYTPIETVQNKLYGVDEIEAVYTDGTPV